MAQAVERTIRILEMLNGRPQHPVDIANALGIHRTTALRALQELASADLANRDESGRFTVGRRLSEFARQVVDHEPGSTSLTHYHVRELSRRTGLPVLVSTVKAGHLVAFDRADPNPSRGGRIEDGRTVSLTQHSAAAKTLLAFQPPASRSQLVWRELRAAGAAVEADRLRRELAVIQIRGWAETISRDLPAIVTIAVPIPAAPGMTTNAALSISTADSAREVRPLRSYLPLLLQTAARIGEASDALERGQRRATM